MQKRKSIIIVSISVLIFGLLSFATFSFFKMIETENKNTTNILNELENKMAEKDNIDAIIKQNKEVASIQSEINAHMVDPASINLFVDDLEVLGAKSNTKVKVKSVEISKEIPNTILGKLSISGYFNDVMQTFALFEHSPYVIHVTNVYLNKNKDYQNPDPKVVPIQIWDLDVSFRVISSS